MKTLQDSYSKSTATKKKHAFTICYDEEEGDSNELLFDNEGGLVSAGMWLLWLYHPTPTERKPNESLSGNDHDMHKDCLNEVNFLFKIKGLN